LSLVGRRRGGRSVVSAVAVLLVALVALWISGGLSSAGDGPGSPSGTSQQQDAHHSGQGTIGTIAYAALPPQARETIDLIDRGGPYPYRQDDGVFGNREGLLPQAPSGTYREYTVETPGSDDRGERRLIKARDGTLYYTDDHYQSFEQVRR
jgi:ribonuclease T1